MTEITVQRKKPVWPWILLGLLIVAFLIYFLGFRDNGADKPTTTATTDLAPVKENDTTVNAFVNFIEENNRREGVMSLDHAYTNEALVKLTNAVNAMAAAVGHPVQEDLSKVKELAGKITNDPNVDTHADDIRRSADLLTTVLQSLQQAKYPGMSNDVQELKTAAASINPDVLTLDQRDAVKSFFAKAADLLKKMN